MLASARIALVVTAAVPALRILAACRTFRKSSRWISGPATAGPKPRPLVSSQRLPAARAARPAPGRALVPAQPRPALQ